MADLKDLIQTADWKKEKHAPVIEVSGKTGKDEAVSLTVSVGKEIPHPNTTAHHISWIEVYFLPEGEKFPYELGRISFVSHGAGAQGADTSTVYTDPIVALKFKTEKPGTILASSYCNIHGLWQASREIK
ncbi:MAG: superoxide reductase [Candidatus Omnitrophica bacterium]|nr:superoxide reductase [Candidatus Omnitrophota bacterium]